MKKILIINAHQKREGMSEGNLNNKFQNEMQTFFESNGIEVQTTKIEAGYDIEAEISKHEWADLVITQTPVYWFNTPWIHKKYIEEVFTDAWLQKRLIDNDGISSVDATRQYGTGGLSTGKKYLLSATWNAPKEAFNSKQQFLFEGKSADEALINLSANYKFCGFEVLEGFHAHNVMKGPQIESDLEHLKLRLQEIILN